MKTVYYPIILTLLLVSCKICKEDQSLKKEFFNCIHIVEKMQKEDYFVKGGDHIENLQCRAFSIECLSAVTGYQGHVDKSTDPHYFYPYSDTIEYIDVDIKKWQEWYENYKCNVTKQMADSLIKKYSIDYGVPGLHWPISADSLVNDDKYIY
jgi:hypothetical protein